MSMDTPQLGLLLGATIAQHEAESARPWATEADQTPAPAPDARTPDPPHARRGAAPPG